LTDNKLRLLDDALLNDLEQRWRDRGAFIAGALLPGLSDEEIDALTEPVGLQLPAEARRWWAWHDGASPQVPGLDIAATLGPVREFRPLAHAVRDCQQWRELMDEDDPCGWKHGWLPIDGNKRPTVFDCGGAFDAPVPVRSYFVEDPTAGQDGVESIGELVSIWIRAIDSGAWSYERAGDQWRYDHGRLDPQIAVTQLA
jgi:cell wall assembly regulator SMI1